jgi:hypothetical protein
MYIFSFLVEGGTEGICTCTEEHEMNYEYNDEQKQISPLHREKWLYTLYMNDTFVFVYVFCCVSFFFIFQRIFYNIVYCILLLLTHVPL